MGNEHEIILGLTTTPGSDWRGKVEEMKKFSIERIALFPTFLKKAQREELYALLETVADLKIPHIHLRSDMTIKEIRYLESRFGGEVFNTHPEGKYHIQADWKDFFSKLYIENATKILEEKDLEKYAGLCLDFSHLENARIKKMPHYAATLRLAEKLPIGCCHVSAIRSSRFNPLNLYFGFDRHYLKDIREIDYIGQYKKYLPKYISLELENSFEQQLEIKRYLEKIISD